MLLCQANAVFVCSFEVEVHHLLLHRPALGRDAFVEEQLVLNLGDRGAFDGGGMGNDRVEIELVVVYLLGDSQPFVLIQNLCQTVVHRFPF